MKHKPFDSWILDNPDLDQNQQKELASHLAVCPQCRKLQDDWLASHKALMEAIQHEPRPGFAHRWSKMAAVREANEKSHQVRRTLSIMAILTISGSGFYAIQNNVLITWLVTALSVLTSLFFSITKGLADIEQLFARQPEVVMVMGFLLIGAIAALLVVFFFVIWHARKGSLAYEK